MLQLTLLLHILYEHIKKILLIHEYFLLKFGVQHISRTAYKTHFSEYCKYGTYVKIGDIHLIDTTSVHNFPFTPDGILHCTPHCMEKNKTLCCHTPSCTLHTNTYYHCTPYTQDYYFFTKNPRAIEQG